VLTGDRDVAATPVALPDVTLIYPAGTEFRETDDGRVFVYHGRSVLTLLGLAVRRPDGTLLVCRDLRSLKPGEQLPPGCRRPVSVVIDVWLNPSTSDSDLRRRVSEDVRRGWASHHDVAIIKSAIARRHQGRRPTSPNRAPRCRASRDRRRTRAPASRQSADADPHLALGRLRRGGAR
jgi:hypothetical protein